MQIKDLVRQEILNLSPYIVEPIRSRKPDEQIMKLDLNENLTISREIIGNLHRELCENVDVRLYPPPHGAIAVKAISEFFGFNNSQIFVGNGVDGVLDSLMRVFVQRKSKVLVVEPTFPLYAYFTQLYGGKTATALLLPNFELDVDGILEECDERTTLLMICSPNNPTGNQFKKADIDRILREFNGLVVVDEAYVDFSEYSILEWIAKFDRLAVLRTFSKAFGLAGIRAGFLVANTLIVGYLKRTTHPFNVNILTQRFVELVFQNWAYFQESIQNTIKERQWLRKALTNIDGVTPYPSDANFILFRVTKKNLSSSIIKKRLERKNIFVKDRGPLPLLKNCIRVTVGTHRMNQGFVSALTEVLEG